jgi:hypothetical protein
MLSPQHCTLSMKTIITHDYSADAAAVIQARVQARVKENGFLDWHTNLKFSKSKQFNEPSFRLQKVRAQLSRALELTSELWNQWPYYQTCAGQAWPSKLLYIDSWLLFLQSCITLENSMHLQPQRSESRTEHQTKSVFRCPSSLVLHQTNFQLCGTPRIHIRL